MTVEDLLKPRYKCIADYPHNRLSVSRIFEPGEIGIETQIKWAKYPHLFKKLEWWEDREEKDMPEYVKLKFRNSFKVCRIDYYSSIASTFTIKKESFLDDIRIFLPASKEEYENQNK